MFLAHRVKRAAGPSPAAGAFESYMNSLSPLAYWRLDEASGTSAADETGSHPATHLSTTGVGVSPLITDGGFAKNYIRTNGNTRTRVSSDVLTAVNPLPAYWFHFRVKTTNTTDQLFLWDRGDSGNSNYRIFLAANRGDPGFFVLDSVCLFSNNGSGTGNLYADCPGITDGNAHSLVFQYDATTPKIYFDGVEVTTTGSVFSGRLHVVGYGHWFGGLHNPANMFDGVLDEVAVGSGTITASEVLDLHNLAIA